MKRRLSLFLVWVALLASSPAWSYDVRGTLSCGEAELALDRAKVDWDVESQVLTASFRSFSSPSYDLVLEIQLRSVDGIALEKHVVSYRMRASCLGREWTLDREAGESGGGHPDFADFRAQLRSGGSLRFEVEGRQQESPDMSWRVELSGSMD